MRKAGAKMFILGRAAGCAPRLHTGHRRAAIFLHDQGQAVRKRPPLRRVWRKTDCRRRHRRGTLEVCAVKHEGKLRLAAMATQLAFGAGRPSDNFLPVTWVARYNRIERFGKSNLLHMWYCAKALNRITAKPQSSKSHAGLITAAASRERPNKLKEHRADAEPLCYCQPRAYNREKLHSPSLPVSP